MAIAKKQLEAIIARDLPGYRLAARGLETDRLTAEPDLIAPDIETLRRKYFGDEAGPVADAPAGTTRARKGKASSRARATKAEAEKTADEEIVAVEPKGPAPFDAAARPKTVIISNGKVVGQQG